MSVLRQLVITVQLITSREFQMPFIDSRQDDHYMLLSFGLCLNFRCGYRSI